MSGTSSSRCEGESSSRPVAAVVADDEVQRSRARRRRAAPARRGRSGPRRRRRGRARRRRRASARAARGSGVIPIPPAISTVLSRRRRSSVKTPSGPSATTRVPGLTAASRAEWSPSALTVIRSDRPSGAADSENGWAVQQRWRSRKRQRKNCPARAPQTIELAPGDGERDDAGRLLLHRRDAQPVPKGGDHGSDDAKADEHDDRGDEEAAPVVGGEPVEHELVAGRDLVEPRERDPGVGHQVDGVPPLVARGGAGRSRARSRRRRAGAPCRRWR